MICAHADGHAGACLSSVSGQAARSHSRNLAKLICAPLIGAEGDGDPLIDGDGDRHHGDRCGDAYHGAGVCPLPSRPVLMTPVSSVWHVHPGRLELRAHLQQNSTPLCGPENCWGHDPAQSAHLGTVDLWAVEQTGVLHTSCG